ncbi:glycosyltransferase 61 family protein [Microcoleus sp. AR_TQ3_B6]|uniref:tetratricopeptide repeat protein n=1 Tax=Microcoleus sp. AR_TQ3_B6 TaxID=3055284 RepID=UPI002FD2CD27
MNSTSDRHSYSKSNSDGGAIAPKDISALNRQAAVYFTQGKFAEAIALCHQVIIIKPDCAVAYDILGATLLSQKKVGAAIRSFSQALAINPNSATILAKLGYCLAAEGRLDEAITTYQKALQLNPNWADVYLKMGNLLSQQNRWEEALDCWLKIAKIAPTMVSAESFVNFGNFHLAQGRLDLASACYRESISQKPDCKLGDLNLGFALKNQGKIPEAIANCIQLLQIRPFADEAYHYLFNLLTNLGRKDEAMACYYGAIPLDLIREFCPSTVDSELITSTSKAKISVLSPQFLPSENLGSNFRETEGENPQPFVAVIPNGRAWGDKYTRAVITSDDRLLEDISTGSPSLIISSNRLPPPVAIEGTVAFLAKNYCYNYYHWMFEFLPQIELLGRSGIDIGSIDKFAVNHCCFPFQRETVSLLGIPLEKIVETDNNNNHIQARQLLVSSVIRESTKWACDFLRREFLNDSIIAVEKKQRIFISRKQRRRVINEDELVAVLSKFGFKSIAPESLSVAEQVSLFANAEVVIGAHGAALTNTVFCSPGTKLIEIFAPDYVNPCYRKLSSQVGLEYWEFIGERVPDLDSDGHQQRGKKIHYVFEDILVNIAALLNMMKLAGAIGPA